MILFLILNHILLIEISDLNVIDILQYLFYFLFLLVLKFQHFYGKLNKIYHQFLLIYKLKYLFLLFHIIKKMLFYLIILKYHKNIFFDILFSLNLEMSLNNVQLIKYHLDF